MPESKQPSDTSRNRFRTVEAALSFAFYMEAKQVAPSSIVINPGGGDPIYERIADGMMIKSFLLRHAGLRGKDILIAHYTVPANRELENKKNHYIGKCAQWMQTVMHRHKWCLSDGVREWTGERPHHNPRWWADHTGKSARTIQRWWYSKDPKDQSVRHLMNIWENQAIERIQPYLHLLE